MKLRTIWANLVQPSLTRRLLAAQLGLLFVIWLASIGYFIYDTAYVNDWYEPQQMRERADMILAVVDSLADRRDDLRYALTKIDEFQRDENRENDDEGVRVTMNVWIGAQLVYASPGKPGVVATNRLDVIETSTQNGRRIRSYARDSSRSAARVAVILPADAESVFLTFWAGGIVLLPFLVSMPILLLPAWLSVRVALQPFRELATQVARKGTHDLEPLTFRARHRELIPLVRSVNGLLRRIREGLLRERRFVADAAHELRTPIAALRVNVEAFLERASAGEAEQAGTRSLLDSLLSSSHRATRLVNQLLALMRSDAPESAAHDQSTNLIDVAQECLAAAAPTARLTNIDVELECTAANGKVRGDRESLTSLLQNLVDNAVKYSPAKGRVLVRIAEQDNRIELTVADEGPGIPAELRQRVFERFYRVTGQAEAGSGLGLAIVKGVAVRLNADIALAVPDWGYGVLVSVSFPTLHSKAQP